jgi:hypothetical protein
MSTAAAGDKITMKCGCVLSPYKHVTSGPYTELIGYIC